MPFIFYDTETTGTQAGFDQILQFAAILTDDDLAVVDSFDIRSRLLPYIVPSPGALLVNGVTVAELTQTPLSHFDMMREIRSQLQAWSKDGTIFIGWNSLRFDETMLRQAYYQTLLPIYQTNTNGNGRADLMRMTQVVSACLPNAITIPISPEGQRTFKLGLVAQANAIALDNAHEALADATATLELAKLLKQRAPALWSALIANARKSTPQGLITNNAVLLLSQTYSGVANNFIVSPIATNAGNANEWALFDLQVDPAELLAADEDKLRQAIDGDTKLIRRVSINAQPGLLPLDFAPDDIRGGRLSTDIYQARAKAIRDHAEFRRRVSRLLSDRYAGKAPPAYVEQRIYDGFPSNADQARMAEFHRNDWPVRPDIVASIDDKRLRELGERIVASERVDLLSDADRRHWDAWRRERLLTTEQVPWLTIPDARAEIAKLRDEAAPEQLRQLAEIERFLTALAG